MSMLSLQGVRPGMRIGRDIYSSGGIKLLTRGSVLTPQQILMLKQHSVREIEIDESLSSAEEYYSVPSQSKAALSYMENAKTTLVKAIRQTPLFAQLESAHIELLAQRMVSRKYEAQSVVFREMEPGDAFFVILTGSIKIYTSGKDGSEKILAVLRSGDSFGELSLLDGGARSASAQTLEKTEVITMNRDPFLDMLQRHFDLTMTILSSMAQRLRDTNDHVADLTFLDARTRVIKSLVKLANRFGRRSDDYIVVQMPLDRGELSQMAGVKVEELNEVLSDLEEKQLLTMYATYFKLNLIKLRTLLR